jgi:hypothetical protein
MGNWINETKRRIDAERRRREAVCLILEIALAAAITVAATVVLLFGAHPHV